MPFIPRDWRTRHERYRMAAAECEVCGAAVFPPRPVCAACARSRQESQHPEAMGLPVLVVTCPAEAVLAPTRVTGDDAAADSALPAGPLTILTGRLDEAGEGDRSSAATNEAA